ncbi:MAG: hypothetical protein ACKPKO_54530, partial [Candidatus Fonsibacter sp.]
LVLAPLPLGPLSHFPLPLLLPSLAGLPSSFSLFLCPPLGDSIDQSPSNYRVRGINNNIKGRLWEAT